MSEAASYQPDRGPIAKLARRARYALGRTPVTCAPERPVLTISFDDFPKGAAREGAALMEAFGARATYFASGCFAGAEGYYDAGDLARLSRAGHEIGCHTYSHIDCARAPLGRVRAELDRNARALSAMGHDAPLTGFAFPYGEASIGAKRLAVSRFGYARGVRGDLNRGRVDAGLLKALCVDGGEAAAARAVNLIASAAREPAWVILFAHGVDRVAGDWSTTPDDLGRCLRAARALGLDILPFSEAAKLSLLPQAARGANSCTIKPAGNPPLSSTSSARS